MERGESSNVCECSEPLQQVRIGRTLGRGTVLGFRSNRHELIKDDTNLAVEPIIFPCGLPQEDADDDLIYAMGIVRQVNGNQRLFGKSYHQSSNWKDSNDQLDNCSCLLTQENRGGPRTVVKCFSMVQLKSLSRH
jgi:hypothetical protein